MERVRLRLVFEGKNILSDAQKKQGLRKSWMLFKPKHLKSISDFTAHLQRIFDLHTTCPHGLILSMEGFVLPPFESTGILKDSDTICVRRKKGECTDTIELDNGVNNALEDAQIVKQPLGVTLLANEEFDKEKGGYCQSEHEENEREKSSDALDLEEMPNVNKVSMKRKASKRLRGTKRKKSKPLTAEESPVVLKDVQNVVHQVKSGSSHQDTSPDVEGEPERSLWFQENSKVNLGLSSSPVRTKKLPSRSARRKKAKRRWLRELAQLEKLQQKQLLAKDNLQSLSEDDQSRRDKKQQLDPDSHGKCNKGLSQGSQRLDPNSDGDDNIFPVVIGPGHIRFEALSKEDAAQALQQNQIPAKTYQWNGITSKKKGQQWGKDKATSSKRNKYKDFNQFSETLNIKEKIPECKDVNFDKLPPYAALPKEGDVIAYRLIELSSSWTPEPTAFQVGKISWYDSESNRIKLTTVPEYPIAFEKKIDEDASALQSDSLYGEDGSLQIDFSLLIDVRNIMHGGEVNEVHGRDQDSVTNMKDNDKHEEAQATAQENGKVCIRDQDALTNAQDHSNNEITHACTQENEKVNAWDEISQVLSAKKAELSQIDDQSTKGSSNYSRWSYKALRSSALGPTMAFLRSQNGL